jgi:hypothetical protein
MRKKISWSWIYCLTYTKSLTDGSLCNIHIRVWFLILCGSHWCGNEPWVQPPHLLTSTPHIVLGLVCVTNNSGFLSFRYFICKTDLPCWKQHYILRNKCFLQIVTKVSLEMDLPAQSWLQMASAPDSVLTVILWEISSQGYPPQLHLGSQNTLRNYTR